MPPPVGKNVLGSPSIKLLAQENIRNLQDPLLMRVNPGVLGPWSWAESGAGQA